MDEEQNKNEEQDFMNDSNLQEDLSKGVNDINNIRQQGKKVKNNIETAGNAINNVGKIGKSLVNNRIPNLKNKINVPNPQNMSSPRNTGFKMPFSNKKLVSNSKGLKSGTSALKLFIKFKGKKILIIGGIILIAILLIISIFVVLDVERQKSDGAYKEGDKSNVAYVVKSTVMDRLVIVSDASGKYIYAFEDDNGDIISLDKALDNALNTLYQNKSNSTTYLGKNKKEKKELLKKMIQAEIATQYPTLDESENLGYTNTIPTYTNTSVAGCNTDLDVTVKENFITDLDKMKKALATYNSTLEEHAQDFLDFQEQYGVNAIFIASVCVWETGGGTTGHAIDGCNNWGNISSTTDPLAGGKYLPSGDHNWAIYPDAKTGIQAVFSLIGERGPYVSDGKKTISQIFFVYNNEDKDEPGLVVTSMAKMYSAANITSVSNASQSGAGTIAKGNKTGDKAINETINDDETVKGGIVIQRKDENGEVKKLKYTSTDNFDALLLKNTDEVFDYYTLKRNVAGVTNSSSSSGDFSGNTNAEIVWNFLTSKGLSDICTAAIIGNLMQESTVNIDPTLVEAGNGIGYGIAQWSYGRRTQLQNYASSLGRDPGDIEVQLQFLWMETDPSAERVGADLQWSEQSYQQFIAMTSIDEATQFFCTKWERAGIPAISNRINKANDVYTLYSGIRGSSDNTTSGTSQTSKVTTLDNFLFIGDSRYEGLKTQLSSLGNNVTVIGVVSSTPSNWVDTTKNGSGTVLSTDVMLPSSVSGVSVMLGVNNLSQIAEMNEVLNNLHAKYPNVPIFFNSVYHMGSSYNNASDMNSKIDEFNAKMKEFCSQNSWAYYIDVNNNLNDDSGFLKGADSSGIHISDSDAKDILTNNIKTAILGAGATNNTSNNVESKNTDLGYSIIVANKRSVNTTITDVYTYQYTISNTAYSAESHGSISSKQSTTSNITYSSSSVKYQEALKNYTLYFDFLWAICVNTNNPKFITKWANLACNNIEEESKVYITVYSETDTSSSSSSMSKPTVYMANPKGYGTDVFGVMEITNIETVSRNSKLAVTFADTWLLKYENNADTYEEFQEKSKEVITEKIDGDSEDNNIVKLLRKNKNTLNSMTKDEYIVDGMIEDNEKVSFMVDIYGYILDVANGKVTAGKSTEVLGEHLDTTVFDLSAASFTYQKKLVYTSITISEEEKDLLYKFVEQLALDGSSQQKGYITSVILNRTLSSKFPNTVEDVINQAGAFENYDSSKNQSITLSDGTKTAVDNVISSGDTSNYSVFFATPETSSKKKWDTKYKATVKDNTYNYYTDEKIIKELQKFETKVAVNSGSNFGSSDLAQQMVVWAEQWVGKSQFYSKARGLSSSTNLCARFVMSAYDEVGLGYYGANTARELPHPNPIKYNSDGTVDWSEIPTGAIIVSDGTGYCGHVALYIGNGYVIEAGGSIVKKSPIDESYGGKGHNCAPFLGWGFATKDQQAAYNALVTSINSGYTQNDGSSTGITGIFSFNGRNHNLYAQQQGSWAKKTYSQGRYETSACGATSVAIIASGYGNNVTPYDTGTRMYNICGLSNGSTTTRVTEWSVLKQALESYGLNCKMLTNSKKQAVIDHLKSGGTVIMLIHNSSIGKSNHKYGGHYVTLLGIDESGKIFLGDPYLKGTNNSWCEQSEIFKDSGFTACLVN